MFDQYESFYNPKRSGWIRLAIGASVIAHVAFGAAFIINAAWKLNKLEIQDAELTMAAFGLPQAAPPALKAERRERVKKPIKRTTDLTQKNDVTENHDTKAGGGNDGNADGDPDGSGDSQGHTVGAPIGVLCPNGNCLGDIAPPKPQVKKEKKPTIVPQSMVKGLLQSGETQIHPDATTKNAILRSGERKVIGVVRTCISTGGRVSSAKVLRSTGHKAYDRKLVAGVRRWRYAPYKVNGTPIPVCTAINFIYKLDTN